MVDLTDFLQWLRTHKEGINFLYDEHKREQDLGYLRACTVIEAELIDKIQESKVDEFKIIR